MIPRKDTLLHRFAEADALSGAPASYDAKNHTVDCVVSTGAAVARPYGTEVLRISKQAVDLSRLQEGGIPFLDHHNQGGIDQVLGRFVHVWVASDKLMGRIKFAQTPQGKKAEGMVARGEIAGISAGYRVDRWEITDSDCNIVDPDKQRVRFDDDLTLTATRWTLFEGSLVGVPADGASMVRSMSRGSVDPKFIRDVRARMKARQKIIGIF